jgi:hypothetical protein
MTRNIIADRELRDLIERVGFACDLADLDGDVSVADFRDLGTHQRILRVLDCATIALRDATDYLARLRAVTNARED